MRIKMRTVKAVIGALFSIVTANSLSLLYWPATGTIALLSVGSTKRSALRAGMNRIAAFILVATTALFSFFAARYTIFGSSLFLSLFTLLASHFELTGRIVVNSVLVTRYLVEESMSQQLIDNEAGLMAIGSVFTLLMNVYVPDRVKQLKENQTQIEKEFRNISGQMAEFLLPENKGDVQIKCERLLTFIRGSQEDAGGRQENYWLKQPLYCETYFPMRRAQVNVIKDMLENLKRAQQPVYYGEHIYGLLIYMAETSSESNDGRQILACIREIHVSYRQMPLLTSCLEFESRTELFQFLQFFKSSIEIKTKFSQQKVKK